MEFVDKYEQYSNPKEQIGNSNYYIKRNQEDSCRDINGITEQQFNLLPIVNSDERLVFFRMLGNRYILKIEIAEDE